MGKLSTGIPGLFIGVLALTLTLPGLLRVRGEPGDSVPDVDFAIFRVDWRSFEPKYCYEFSQPFRKILLEPPYVPVGSFQYWYEEPADFGFLLMKSGITGQSTLAASSIYMGAGCFYSPGESLRTAWHEAGQSVPEPVRRQFLAHPYLIGGPAEADSAWSRVRDTDVIARLAAEGPYEVVVSEHFYTMGGPDPRTAEWFVVAATLPPAPDDLALLELPWPRGLLTARIPLRPEITVHNFGASPLDADLRVRAWMGPEPWYESQHLLGLLPPDSTCTLTFDPVTAADTGSVRLEVDIRRRDGTPWGDPYPDNDVWRDTIAVVTEPIFRLEGMTSRPGRIPLGGTALDFDSDGDADIFQYGGNPRLWENDGTGNFTDVTARLPISLPASPNSACMLELTGDGHPDLLIVKSGQGSVLLAGDGTGNFEDVSWASGLGGRSTWGMVAPLDLERDGDLDLLFPATGREIVMQNDGTGHFVDVYAETGIHSWGPDKDASAGDLDGDGDDDVIIACWGSAPAVFVNDGSGHFTPYSESWGVMYAYMTLIQDLDGDSLSDVVIPLVNDAEARGAVLLHNLGDLRFEFRSLELPPSFSRHAAAYDLTGDGLPELVLDLWDHWKIFINQDGTFVDRTELLADLDPGGMPGARGAQFVDLDGDRDIDLYALGAVFENQGDLLAGPPDPTPPSPPRSLEARPSPGSIELRWTAPPDSDLAGVLLRYATDGYPFGPASGWPVPNGAGGRFPATGGMPGAFVHTALQDGAPYYYSAFAYDSQFNHSIPLQVTAVPGDYTPLGLTLGIRRGCVAADSLDLFLIGTKSLDAPTVGLWAAGQALPARPLDLAGTIWMATLPLAGAADSIPVVVSATDLYGNEQRVAYPVSIGRVSAGRGGSAASLYGSLRATVSDEGAGRDAVLLMLPLETADPIVIGSEVFPGGLELSPLRAGPGSCPTCRFRLLASDDLVGGPILLEFRYDPASLPPGTSGDQLVVTGREGAALETFFDAALSLALATAPGLGDVGLETGAPGSARPLDRRYASLEPPAPNPFTSSTRIRFALRAPQRAEVSIYEVTGRKVLTLFEGAVFPGMRELAWDGRGEDGRHVASGIYLCRLSTEHGSSVRKLVRVR